MEPAPLLTAKQKEAAELEAAGMSRPEVAEILGVSRTTVWRWGADRVYLRHMADALEAAEARRKVEDRQRQAAATEAWLEEMKALGERARDEQDPQAAIEAGARRVRMAEREIERRNDEASPGRSSSPATGAIEWEPEPQPSGDGTPAPASPDADSHDGGDHGGDDGAGA